jgi:hypothetical protein
MVSRQKNWPNVSFPFFRKKRFQSLHTNPGLPDFSLHSIPKRGKIMCQKTINYTKWQKLYQMAVDRPNGHKIYQHLPLQDPPKFTQIGIFV